MTNITKVKDYVPTGILFLQGVFKKDCKRLEDMFEENIRSNTKLHETKVYDKIPVNFVSLDTWFKTTNLNCWYCNRTFKTRPWFEPQSIEPVSEVSSGQILRYDELRTVQNVKQLSIVITGIFCTCNCVRAYIELHTKDISDKLNKVEMLKFVYEIFNNKKIPDIQPSPPPTEMVQYGGSLSILEYQQKIDSLDNAYQKELEDNNFTAICNVYTNGI
jgi:hypothetical protein